MTVRATGRHRAGAPVSTPLTTMTAAIATKVPSASAARSGFVIAVSSGLVAGVGLPAQAADATSDGATTTALKLPALAPAADQVAVDQAVSAPATATVHFERSTMSVSSRGGAPDAYEVSCRVRVGEVTRPGVPGFTPRDGSRRWVPRLCPVIGTSRGRWQSSASPPRSHPYG